MPFLIGTDEAGYGPNLGPLTITGTLWETPDLGVDLYDQLDAIVADTADRKKIQETLFVADSKKVYSGSIQNLETSVLAMLYGLTGSVPNSWEDLVGLICPPHRAKLFADQEWLSDASLKLPMKSDSDVVRRLGEAFRKTCDGVNVNLIEIQCVPVFPPEFNQQVDRLGNKATLLSTATLTLVRRLLDKANDDVEIGCDKHGGRSKYTGILQSVLTQELVTVGEETTHLSDYTFRENDRDVFIRFQAKGESFLPTALSSMVSKYVREVFMEVWNDFWRNRIPELKPTKGYPVDAKRFKSEIELVQKALGIEDWTIWRKR